MENRNGPHSPDKVVFDQAELAPEQSEQRTMQETGRRLAIIGATAALAIGGVGYGAWRYFDKSGEFTSYDPPTEQPITTDNKFVMGSWNMHGQAASHFRQIEQVADRYQLDAIALQEVTVDDSKLLTALLPKWHQRFGFDLGEQLFHV